MAEKKYQGRIMRTSKCGVMVDKNVRISRKKNEPMSERGQF